MLNLERNDENTYLCPRCNTEMQVAVVCVYHKTAVAPGENTPLDETYDVAVWDVTDEEEVESDADVLFCPECHLRFYSNAEANAYRESH